jgi:hypothetical protein
VKRIIVGLAGLLLLQLVVTVLVYRPPAMMQSEAAHAPLVRFTGPVIKEIHVGDERNREVILTREGDGWRLPDLDNLPADAEKVDALIEAITSKDHGWPVADTVAARQRFQVAAYHFRRRLTLIGEGELLGTVYLGTSPGFRQVHARNDAGEAIYSIAFNVFDAPAEPGGWLDRTLLQIGNPQAITGPGFALERRDNRWLNSAGTAPDDRELQALLLGLASLQVEAIADEDDQRSLAETGPALSLRIRDAEGEMTLELFQLGDAYAIYHSRYPVFFMLSAYDFDRLTGIDAARLAGSAEG